MYEKEQDKFARQAAEWRSLLQVRTDHPLRRQINRRSAGVPFGVSAAGTWKDRASVIGKDLARYYALVEKAGLDEVPDMFTPAEVGALLCACDALELDELDAAGMSWVLHGELERHGRLEYWGVDDLAILRKIDKLSVLARHFLLWRLDEQARFSGHHPARETIELVAEDLGLKSRNWGPEGWAVDAPRFYSGVMTVPDFGGCKDVTVTLVRYGRPRPVLPYNVLIGEDYRGLDEAMREYVEDAVDELLTRNEMDCVKSYVEQEFGLSVRLWERDVHRDVGSMPLSGLPTGGGVGRVLLGGSKDLKLPFPVACCYDLRRHESIDNAEEGGDGAEPEPTDERAT